jgi:hypothetical protein
MMAKPQKQLGYEGLKEALNRRQPNIPGNRNVLRYKCVGEFHQACDLLREQDGGMIRQHLNCTEVDDRPDNDPSLLYDLVTSSTKRIGHWLRTEASYRFPLDNKQLAWINQDLAKQIRMLLEATLSMRPAGKYKPDNRNLHLTLTRLVPYHTFTYVIAMLIGHDQFELARKLLQDNFTTKGANRNLLAFAAPDILKGKHAHQRAVTKFLNHAVARTPGLVEADLLIYTFACLQDGWLTRDSDKVRWKPLFYRACAGNPAERLYHVTRAETADGLENLCALLGKVKPTELDKRDKLREEVRAKLGNDKARDRNVPVDQLIATLRVDRWGALDPKYEGLLGYDLNERESAAQQQQQRPFQRRFNQHH